MNKRKASAVKLTKEERWFREVAKTVETCIRFIPSRAVITPQGAYILPLHVREMEVTH